MTLEEKMDECREEGREEGIKENSLRVAKAMKEKGYHINDIIELTKISKEEVESL